MLVFAGYMCLPVILRSYHSVFHYPWIQWSINGFASYIIGVLLRTVHAYKTLYCPQGIEAWAALDLDAKFGVNVGDESGPLYKWVSNDGFTMQTRLEGSHSM